MRKEMTDKAGYVRGITLRHILRAHELLRRSFGTRRLRRRFERGIYASHSEGGRR